MIESVSSSIQGFVQLLGDRFLPFAMAMSAVGVATMAIIQMAREIFPIRRKFHEFEVRRWFDKAAAHVQEPEILEAWKKAGVAPPDPAKAFHQLVRLTTAGDANALLSLEIERLAGQMAAASRVAADFPPVGPDFMHCLAAYASPADLARVEAERAAYASLRRRIKPPRRKPGRGSSIISSGRSTGFRSVSRTGGSSGIISPPSQSDS